MWPRFGIKIGNSTLCIAQIKDENTKPEVIANKQGDRVSAACLLWDGNKEIECGLTAKQKMATRPKQAVANSFQLLHPVEVLNEEQILKASKEMPCEYAQEQHMLLLTCSKYDESSDSYKHTTHEMSVYDVHVKLFAAELELAQQYLTTGHKKQKPTVVLSIPSYYASSSRLLLAKVAEEAGFHVAQVVSEPTAALLAYGIGEERQDNKKGTFVMTVKCGGLFSSFTLYEVHNGLYTELVSSGPFDIGGRQITDAVAQFISEEFHRKYKLDPNENRRCTAKIMNAAENCKHILTTLPSTKIFIDSLMDGVDFSAQMSRARFESLIQPVVNNFMQTLGECVDNWLQHNTAVQVISDIVLLGGSMQIPKLQSAVAAKFPNAQIHYTLPANEAVAIGCASQANYLIDPLAQELQPSEECVCVQEKLTLCSVADVKKKDFVLLEQGAPLPSSAYLNLEVDELLNNKTAELQLRCGSELINVALENVSANEDGYVCIDADVKRCTDDNAKLAVQLMISP